MDSLKSKEMLIKLLTVTLKNHSNSKNLKAGFKYIYEHAKHKIEIGNVEFEVLTAVFWKIRSCGT
jgi:hypothetical protein